MGQFERIDLKEVACPLCGLHDGEIVLSAEDYLCGVPGIFSIQKCKACGMCYLNPAPRAEDLYKIYPHIYHEGFINQQPFWIKERLAFIKTISPGGRLLEVGCAAGHFLARAGDAGYEVFGVELDAAAGEYARSNYNLNVETGSVMEAELPDSFFNLIVLFDVFEHLTEPVSCLKKLIAALAGGGHIVIRVPNFSSREARLFKENWYPLDLPRHLLHFSPGTLLRMLSGAGFSFVKIIYEVEPEILVLSVIRYIYNMLDKKTGTSLANKTGDSGHVTRRLRLKQFVTKSLAIPFFIP